MTDEDNDIDKLEEIKRKAAEERIQRRIEGRMLGTQETVARPKEKKDMGRGVKFSLLVVGALVVAVLARYGTVSPCGMLEQDLRAEAMRAMFKDGLPSDGLQAAGSALGISLANNMIEGLISSLGPMQCTKALWRLHVTDEKPLEGLLADSEVGFGKSSKPSTVTSGKTRKELEQEKEEWLYPKELRLEEWLYPKEWRLNVDSSPMDESKIVTLMAWADKSVDDWFDNDHRASLVLRCRDNRTEAYIAIGAEPEGKYGDDYAYLRVRYDDGPAKQLKFNRSAKGETVFFSSAIQTIKEMMGHEKMLVEVSLRKMLPQHFGFQLSGLKEQIKPLRSACSW